MLHCDAQLCHVDQYVSRKFAPLTLKHLRAAHGRFSMTRFLAGLKGVSLVFEHGAREQSR